MLKQRLRGYIIDVTDLYHKMKNSLFFITFLIFSNSLMANLMNYEKIVYKSGENLKNLSKKDSENLLNILRRSGLNDLDLRYRPTYKKDGNKDKGNRAFLFFYNKGKKVGNLQITQDQLSLAHFKLKSIDAEQLKKLLQKL